MFGEKLSSSSDVSFWQSHVWKDILLSSGQAKKVHLFSALGQSILIEFRSLGMGFIGAFSLGIDESHYTPEFFQEAHGYIRDHGAIFWQREECVYDLSGGKEFFPKNTYSKNFLEPYTRLLDLSHPSEAILSQMHEKGRYNIRYAEKHGVECRWADPSPDTLLLWNQLLHETTARDGFAHNSSEYYECFLENLKKNDMGGLLFAFYGDRVIAAGIFVIFSDTMIYYYGASTSDKELRKLSAPYLLMWEAMMEGKKRGCRFYDFLGVSPPHAHDDKLQGVTKFKEKFGGTRVFIGQKIFESLSWKCRIYFTLRRIKTLMKGG